jgi:hypothetical protein
MSKVGQEKKWNSRRLGWSSRARKLMIEGPSDSVYLACAKLDPACAIKLACADYVLACARIAWKSGDHSATLACARWRVAHATPARDHAKAARENTTGRMNLARAIWIWGEAKLARKSERYKSQVQAQWWGSEIWKKNIDLSVFSL